MTCEFEMTREFAKLLAQMTPEQVSLLTHGLEGIVDGQLSFYEFKVRMESEFGPIR